MAIHHVSAHALRTRPLGEADLIVELYTLERGRVRAVAKSSRRIKSRYGSCFELLTRSRVVFFQRDKDDLGRISSCEIERSWFALLSGIREAAAGAYMAELLIGFGVENDPAPTLFRLVGAVLDGMQAGLSVEVALRYFEVWVLKASGLLPDPRACGRCGEVLRHDVAVSTRTLEFVCRSCASEAGPGRNVSGGALALLGAILRNSPGQLRGAAEATRGEARALAVVTRTLVCGHLDRVPRSMRYLDRVRA